MLLTETSVRNTAQRIVASAQSEAELLALCDTTSLTTAGSGKTPIPSVPGYQIFGEIHRGAQGIVYEAKRLDDDVPLAVKVLSNACPLAAMEPKRFEREIELLQRLNHPGIVPILAHGVVGDRRYFVMPLIDGQPLDEASQWQAPTLDEKVRMLANVTAVVEAAHRVGVIHRDLKPSNILIDQQQNVHLIDFGLAKLQPFDGESSLHSVYTSLTLPGQFIGSLPWSSPEHTSFDVGRIDVRSDVYALGVMLYQLTTGVLPHQTDGGPLALLERIRHETPESPSSLDGRIPKDLETIILKCLHKDPDRRYQSAGQLREDLNRWLACEPVEARRDSTLYVLSQTAKKHKFASFLIALVGIGGLLLGSTMTILYQQAAAQVAATEAENAKLKRRIAELENRLLQPRSWMSAIQSADDLREMPAEEGWAFMQQAWRKLETVETKQQCLKAIAFSGHPYAHRGLHLGMGDASPGVQAWAAEYLTSIALFDVAEDVDQFAKWYAESSDQTLDQVLAASVTRVAKEISASLLKQDHKSLSKYVRRVEDLRNLWTEAESEAVRVAAAKSELAISLLEILEEDVGGAGTAAAGALARLPLEDEFVKQHLVPLLNGDSAQRVSTAARMVGRVKADWAREALVSCLLRLDPSDKASPLSTVATALAEQDDPRAIPAMIAVIDSDNTHATIYGVGYFGLGKLTGVKYDESHDGPWWRTWWKNNRKRYRLSEADASIPVVRRAKKPIVKTTDAVQMAGGDDMAKYILYRGGKASGKPPETGYKLLFILPGGDASAKFQGFCKSIAKNTTDKTFLVAQLIAPVWSESEAPQIVWPTRRPKYKGVLFTTEEHAVKVLDDIGSRHPIDKAHVYTLAWSSGGPAAYALSLAKELPISGSFIAMSVYKPQQLPPRAAAKGKSFYLLHSPQDYIAMRYPENARRQLEAAGAHVKLQTYEGGHGWKGDVFGQIRTGLQWLEEQAAQHN